MWLVGGLLITQGIARFLHRRFNLCPDVIVGIHHQFFGGEQHLYLIHACKLAHGIASLMPPVDKYLYLDCSVSTIIEHMRQRGREYEDDLDLMYVYELKELYDEWAKTLPPERTLRINMDGGEYDLNEIVRFLEA